MTVLPATCPPPSALPRWVAIVAAALIAVFASTAAAQTAPGTTTPRPELVLGMSAALTGSAGGLGTDMRIGIEAAFAEVNRAGGIHGCSVRLIVLNDGYEPARTAPNMKQLIEGDRVLAVIGNIGTPTAVVAIPIAQQSGTCFFGAFTGAGVLRRTPPDRYVINYRASYAEETAAMVGALIEHAGVSPDQIAFFTQRDSYGDAGFNGGMAALRARGLPKSAVVAHGRYDRNTDAVEEAVADILAASTPPKAVIMVGTAKPSAKFVRLARESGLNARMLSVSFAGATQLAGLLGMDAEGVIVGRVVPQQNADLPIIREFRAAVTSKAQQGSEVALEGYIVGRLMCRALDSIKGDPTRETIVDALEKLGTFDLGLGVPLNLSKERHQACARVWATRVHNGAVEPMEWSALTPASSTMAVPETAR